MGYRAEAYAGEPGLDGGASARAERDEARAEVERLLIERLELRSGYDQIAEALGLFPGASPAEVVERTRDRVRP